MTFSYLNKDTQKAQSAIKRYNANKLGSSIFDAYKKPSAAKIHAFKVIKNEMDEVGGKNMRITGAGCDVFSCAYQLGNDLIWHTPCYRFRIENVFNS